MNHRIAVPIAGLITILGVLYLCFAIFFDGHIINVPLTVHGQPATMQSTYAPGDVLNVRIDYCKNRPLDATIQCTLVDDVETFFSPKQASNPTGCRVSVISIAVLPPTLHSGVYHLECNATYHINSFNSASVPWRTNDFEVVK